MAEDLIGKKIGGYEIIEIIGRGGMATVYRAHQVSVNRIVAIKLLPRQFLNDDAYMQRFNREVQIAAQLEHRNIVPVHDYGEYEGQPFIVMRYMPGGSVDDRLRKGALPLDQIVLVLNQIAPALDFAHSKHVLHRDLKPSNILLDSNDGAYLTDFGIARVMGESSSPITTQGVIGTPSYMSPEQAQGKPLDGRSDLYSLGVSLFEMTTGRRPFESDTPYGIAVKQVTEPPPPPRSYNPDLPAAVEQVILVALSKNPQARYQDAVTLAEAFQRAATTPANHSPDTQPKIPRPTPPEAPPVDYPPPPVQQATPPIIPKGTTRTPYPPVRPRRRGSSNLIFGAGLGVLLGCALLTLIVIAVSLVVINTNQQERALQQTLTATARSGARTPQASLGTPGSTSFNGRPSLGMPEDDIPPEGSATVFAPVGEPPTATLEATANVSGSILFFAEREGNFDIYRLNLETGEERRLTTHAAIDIYPAVSPDGSEIVFSSNRDGDYDIYRMDANGQNVSRLTNNTITDRIPAWSPDGEWILFSSDTRDDGGHDLFQIHPDGQGLSLLYSDGQRNSHPRMSADGRYVIFTGGDTNDATLWEIRRLDLQTLEVMSLTLNRFKDWSPTFAPDGSIVYLTEGSGHAAIAQMDIDGENQRVIYDGAGAEWGASYNPDGDALVFTSDESGRDELYLLTLAGETTPGVGTPGVGTPNAETPDFVGAPRRLTDAGGMYAWWEDE